MMIYYDCAKILSIVFCLFVFNEKKGVFQKVDRFKFHSDEGTGHFIQLKGLQDKTYKEWFIIGFFNL